MSSRFLATNLFLLGFLAIQLALPLRGLVRDRVQSRGDFSWNMYASRYQCRIGYLRVDRDGSATPVDYKEHFRRKRVAMRVFHREDLPTFHDYLCRTLSEDPSFWRLGGTVTCQVNEGAMNTLLPENSEVCSAGTYGAR